MKKIVELDIEDIKKIIAEKFGVEPNEVELTIKKRTVGYGMGEHEKDVLECRVELKDKKEGDYWCNR